MTRTVERREMATPEQIKSGLSHGTAFFTPELVQAGIRLAVGGGIPPLAVTRDDLSRMKRLNHCLIWQADQTLDGDPITMKAFHDACGNTCHQDGKFLYDIDWYKKEAFFTKQASRRGWHEISLAPIPESFSKTFCQQLRVLADYLKTEIWSEGLPEAVQAAIAEFEAQEQKLLKLEQEDWQAAAKHEAALQLCQFLATPVEQAVLMLVHQKTNGERFLGNVYSRTGTLSSDGELVRSGGFDSGGADVYDCRPSAAHGALGVCFSRSVKE